MVIDDTCFEKEVNPVRMMKQSPWNNVSFIQIVSFISSLKFTVSRLYDGACKNCIGLCKGFGFELFFLLYFWGFIPLNGIQIFIESEAKRTKIGETAAIVVLFDPVMKLSFRNL